MRLNKPNRDQAESGQAIVLIGLMMVVLFAFTGLAIDGGGLFFLYRDAQNATDAAVLAAAYAQCVNGDVTAAALQAADENGFDNATDNIVTVRQGASVILPAGVSLSPTVKNNLVQVQIDAEKPSYFIQVVYPGPLSVTSRSVSYCRKAVDFSTLPGGLAMGECGNTIDFSGSDVTVDGSMHSNNEMKLTGASHVVREGPITLSNPGLVEGSPSFDPPELEPSAPSPKLTFEANNPLLIEYALYRPGGEVWEAIPAAYRTYIDADHPEMGSNGTWAPQNEQLEGLYMVEGDIQVKNGVTYGPEGVTMIATGTIDFDGDSVDPNSLTHYYNGIMNETSSGIRYPGFILATAFPRNDFTDTSGPTNCGNASSNIQFSGPDNKIEGIIYAPNTTIKFSASSNVFRGMLIAQDFEFSNSSAVVVLNPDLAPPRPPVVHYSE